MENNSAFYYLDNDAISGAFLRYNGFVETEFNSDEGLIRYYSLYGLDISFQLQLKDSRYFYNGSELLNVGELEQLFFSIYGKRFNEVDGYF